QARLGQVCAGAIDHHITAFIQPMIYLRRNTIGQAVCAPAHGEGAAGLETFEFLEADRLSFLANGFGRARDDPSGDAHAAFYQALARGFEQAVLARAGRTDEIDQPAFHLHPLLGSAAVSFASADYTR